MAAMSHVYCGVELEQELHRELDSSRCRGEWFYPTDHVISRVGSLLGWDELVKPDAKQLHHRRVEQEIRAAMRDRAS